MGTEGWISHCGYGLKKGSVIENKQINKNIISCFIVLSETIYTIIILFKNTLNLEYNKHFLVLI